MPQISKTILFLTGLFISQFTFSQSPNQNSKIGILIGSVLDSVSKKPLEYVSIKLYSAKDSTIKGGVFTDVKGKINLDEITLGKYYIKVVFATYNTIVISGVNFTAEKPNRDLGEILLSPEKSQKLDEIKIVGKTEAILNNIDKKVYNVADDNTVKGGSATDILKNVPSIEIDQDGKISLRGDGNVTILIDGRPSSIAGGNGKSFLESLPANTIERIEVVTNPSAKYDPDGTSGIINIVLKKNKLKGINGNVSLSLGTGNLLNGTAGLSLRNAKMNVYGTYSYKYYEGYRNYESLLERTLNDTSIFILDQNREGTDLMINHVARVGSDFYLNDRNTFGLSVTANLGDRERTGNLKNLQLDGNDIINREWDRISSDPNENQSMDFNMNYKIDFKKEKGSLLFDANHSRGTDANSGFYHEEYISRLGYLDNTADLFQQLNNKDVFNVSTFQADLVRILPKSMKFEGGAKAILRNSQVLTYSETQDTVSKQYVEDTVANFQYEYVEQIYSLYGNFAQQYKKFKYQLGLRAEQALQAPNLLSDTLSFENRYRNIFPSAFVKYELAKEQELSLSYSRRINRPTAENLNPFTSYADPFNLRMGNPALKPEYINSFDLGYSLNRKKVNLTVSVFYRQTNSVISRVKTFYDNGATAVTYANIDNSESFGPEIIFIYRPFTWMKNVISGNGNSIKYTDDTQGFDWNNSGFFWSVKYAGTFDYWKKTAIFQINAQYNSPRITPQGQVQPRASMDISSDKTLKGGKWNIGLRLTDVFNTQEFRMKVEQPGTFQEARFKQNTRRLYLNISYKFGKYEIKKAKNDNGGGGFDM
ncbi:MAG: TonB-dependent receptor domain-containing protein [Flavobacteriia bacterium]|jgi:outer membrane receptor protein involved in Fe transport